MLKIYGIQLFLPCTKIKDACSCRPYRQQAVYACTCRVTSSFFGSHLPGLICIRQLSFFVFCLRRSPALHSFRCLHMPFSRGEAYLQRLGGKGRNICRSLSACLPEIELHWCQICLNYIRFLLILIWCIRAWNLSQKQGFSRKWKSKIVEKYIFRGKKSTTKLSFLWKLRWWTCECKLKVQSWYSSWIVVCYISSNLPPECLKLHRF